MTNSIDGNLYDPLDGWIMKPVTYKQEKEYASRKIRVEKHFETLKRISKMRCFCDDSE